MNFPKTWQLFDSGATGKSLSLSNLYTYRVTWSVEDKEYLGLCAEFPSLSWLAQTQEEALHGISQVVQEVTLDMQQSGNP